LFEFKMSYREPDFHKPSDPPFTFPPKDVNSKLDANLVEIEGSNGTGKTTLLNCLALAFGYMEQEKDLDQKKPMLARKLEKLEGNPTLSYSFTIRTQKHEPVELKVERKENQKQQCWLNSKPIDLDALAGKFEVVFLTEDDPRKVVSASLGKLAGYFKTLDSRLNSLQDTLTKNLMDIRDFRNFKRKEEEILSDIVECERRITKAKAESADLKEKLRKVELRDDVGNKIELLSDEKQIASRYEDLRVKYEQLKDKEEPELIRKLSREKLTLNNADLEIRNYNGQIIQICSSLKHHGTNISSEKLLNDDYSEFNHLKKNIAEMEEKAARMRIVDDMIELFQRHPEREMVPLIEKTVRETISALIMLKRSLGDDRVFGLFTALDRALTQRKNALQNFDRIQGRIAQLSVKIKNLQGLEEIEKKFSEAERRYLDLQKALKEDRVKLHSQWNQLRSVKGDPEPIRNQLRRLEVQVESEERVKSGCEQRLRILRENTIGKPKYADDEKEIETLSEMTTRLRENIFQWTRILEEPESAKKDFASSKERPGFGASDYQKFVNAVGEFLGNQFEPVAYNFKLHDIKFYDIENNAFVTKEERHIPIDDLSRGQSKVATLRKIFKEMDTSKKKIVLIDEIADLDPENMQYVKNTLKEKFSEGSVLLAVLVRPAHESCQKLIEIRGWG